jgi:hypothetical protein
MSATRCRAGTDAGKQVLQSINKVEAFSRMHAVMSAPVQPEGGSKNSETTP